MSDSHDDYFVRNLLVILAEQRALLRGHRTQRRRTGRSCSRAVGRYDLGGFALHSAGRLGRATPGKFDSSAASNPRPRPHHPGRTEDCLPRRGGVTRDAGQRTPAGCGPLKSPPGLLGGVEVPGEGLHGTGRDGDRSVRQRPCRTIFVAPLRSRRMLQAERPLLSKTALDT